MTIADSWAVPCRSAVVAMPDREASIFFAGGGFASDKPALSPALAGSEDWWWDVTERHSRFRSARRQEPLFIVLG